MGMTLVVPHQAWAMLAFSGQARAGPTGWAHLDNYIYMGMLACIHRVVYAFILCSQKKKKHLAMEGSTLDSFTDHLSPERSSAPCILSVYHYRPLPL